MSGYDYDFVDNIPDRLLCQICRLPCRDPQRSVCCGHVFCKSEIDQHQTREKSCPQCFSENFTAFIDKLIQREINELLIYCSNKKDGCGWTGEIGRVNDHSKECKISCSKCKQIVYFSTMRSHLDTECPCYCPYCDITAEREVISSEHKEKCHKFPITCPNNCSLDGIPRDDMDEHKKVCPLQMIQCEYQCGAVIARNKVEQHNENSILQHIYSVKHELTISFQNATELESKYLETERTLVTSTASLSDTLKTIVFNLRSNALNAKHDKSPSNYIMPIDLYHFKYFRLMIMSQQLLTILMIVFLLYYAHEYYTTVIAKSDLSTVSDIDINISLVIHDLIDKTPYFSLQNELQLEYWSKIGLVAPVIIEMPDVNTHKNNKLVWFSNPFYAFKGGYLMCMKVSVAGYEDGEDTYMSVFLHLMKGQYDNELSWPMRGEYTIALLAIDPVFMRITEKHYMTVQFDTNITTVVENYQRVMMGKMNHIGIGFPQYISHAKLFRENYFGQQHFLSRHNSLFFKISYKKIV